MAYTQFLLRRYCCNENLGIAVKHILPGFHGEERFHCHDFSEIAVIAHGTPYHLIGGRSCSLSPGDVLLLHEGVWHAYGNVANLECVNLLYDPLRLREEYPGLEVFSLYCEFFPERDTGRNPLHPLLHLGASDLSRLLELCASLKRELDENRLGYECGGRLIFGQILLALARWREQTAGERKCLSVVDAALDYMHTHFCRRISIRALSEMVHMSERNFYRHFREKTGFNPTTYLLRIRMEYAASILRESDDSVAEIARKCGCCDSSDFYRKFKSVYGCSPRDFRRGFEGRGKKSNSRS